MSRKKSLTEQESERLRSSSDLWERVEIEKTGMPDCIGGIPKNQVHAVYASASSTPVGDSSGRVVHGGLDVYRYAEIRDNVLYNKDHYTLVTDSATGSEYIVVGPEKDQEHWTNDLPKLPKKLKVVRLS
jgi:hypothetical protein